MNRFYFDLQSAHFSFDDPEGQMDISLDEAFSVAISSAQLFADVCRTRRVSLEGATVVVRSDRGIAFCLHVAEVAHQPERRH
ncbi:MAG: hypothetical protein Q7T73_14690 [Beijerinckiaceae bacterium]|nr:hypothetical protein [Beijerinckiaceae bacterium]